jgi:hypothetical protein
MNYPCLCAICVGTHWDSFTSPWLLLLTYCDVHVNISRCLIFASKNSFTASLVITMASDITWSTWKSEYHNYENKVLMICQHAGFQGAILNVPPVIEFRTAAMLVLLTVRKFNRLVAPSGTICTLNFMEVCQFWNIFWWHREALYLNMCFVARKIG